MGMATVDIFELLGVIDVNSLMPPNAPGTETEDFNAIRACWEDGPDNTPNCEWSEPPGVYCSE